FPLHPIRASGFSRHIKGEKASETDKLEDADSITHLYGTSCLKQLWNRCNWTFKHHCHIVCPALFSRIDHILFLWDCGQCVSALTPCVRCCRRGCACSPLPLQIHSRALTLQTLTHSHRFGFPRVSKYPKFSYTTITSAVPDLSIAVDNHATQRDRHIIRRVLLHKEPPPRLPEPLFNQSDSMLQEAPVWQRVSRSRRHANTSRSGGHGHLMRVGCVLGTCQVQNLSHRLYQLIGQSGREDSSPINAHSPHSYG
uniref:Adrenomedullin 2b n=2 Tax=Monopterus albus TaxID=43700 RepID=A0A3Q3QIB2_MONAL